MHTKFLLDDEIVDSGHSCFCLLDQFLILIILVMPNSDYAVKYIN